MQSFFVFSLSTNYGSCLARPLYLIAVLERLSYLKTTKENNQMRAIQRVQLLGFILSATIAIWAQPSTAKSLKEEMKKLTDKFEGKEKKEEKPPVEKPLTVQEIAANKALVVDFFNMAFNQHKTLEAVEKHLGSKYVQHNPNLADGKEAFVVFFNQYFKEFPQAHSDIKHVITDGHLVVVHSLSKSSKTDPGRAVMDIFRVAGGKISEHWDVAQPVSDHPLNKNTMF
jgi:predicted SnoaL-like aldol condensation-catalyzing enzyme